MNIIEFYAKLNHLNIVLFTGVSRDLFTSCKESIVGLTVDTTALTGYRKCAVEDYMEDLVLKSIGSSFWGELINFCHIKHTLLTQKKNIRMSNYYWT